MYDFLIYFVGVFGIITLNIFLILLLKYLIYWGEKSILIFFFFFLCCRIFPLEDDTCTPDAHCGIGFEIHQPGLSFISEIVRVDLAGPIP